ncbi:MAG: ribonuclease P protein component [Pyrinomonadaceae bacterium]|nr:ribonuclease P protein component [Pyrinomonadaceae bacterium]
MNSASLLGFRLPKECRLTKASQFQLVYAQGKRFEGKYMTVFVMPSEGVFHKLGITASRKALGKAHDRNRAKRLIREAFRLNNPFLYKLKKRYWWVVNAKRTLLDVKLKEPLEELEKIIEAISDQENKGEI